MLIKGDMLEVIDNPKKYPMFDLLVQQYKGIALLFTDAPYNKKITSKGERLPTDRFDPTQMETFFHRLYPHIKSNGHVMVRVLHQDFPVWAAKAKSNGFKVDVPHFVMKDNSVCCKGLVMRNGKMRPNYACYLHLTKSSRPKINKKCFDWTGQSKNPTTGFAGVMFTHLKNKCTRQHNGKTVAFRDEVTVQEAAQYIEWYTVAGDLVVDPMAGTMSTGTCNSVHTI